MPFFEGMDLRSYLILVLGVLAMLLVVADLSSELSKEKDEIGFFTASLENLEDGCSDSMLSSLIVPSTGIISFIHNDLSTQNNTLIVHSERGPPLS